MSTNGQECREATAPRVWVGCLSCHNSGRLNGRWMAPGDALDLVSVGLARVGTYGNGCTFNQCLVCSGDEFDVFDVDNMPPVAAGVTMATMGNLAELMTLDHDSFLAACAYADTVGYSLDSVEWVGDCFDTFCGIWPSLTEWCTDWAQGAYCDAPAWLAPYVDYAAMARDLVLSGDIVALELGTRGVGVWWAQ